MTVQRVANLWFVECDTCGEACDEDGETFQQAIDNFKLCGGRVWLDDDGEWQHTCKDCR